MKVNFLLAVTMLSLVSNADAFETEKTYGLIEAFQEGEVKIDGRLRYEDVDQDLQGAQALTLRSRLTFKTQDYNFFSALIQVDDVTALPDDENYNSGSNGENDDLQILDPEGTEVNQAWLAFDASNTVVKYGRQTVMLNNERLIGAEPWRQNEQTFTGLTFRNENLNLIRFYLGQLNSVQRVIGEEHPLGHNALDAKFVNVEYRGFWSSELSLYSLWLNEHKAQTQWESKTYGMWFSGELGGEPGGGLGVELGGDFSLDFQLAYAHQEDAGHNPVNYSADYSLLEFDAGYNKIHIKLGREVLGADDAGYFVTPLASLHEVQGWTDQFSNAGLGNIPGGIRDSYLGAGYQCNERYSVNMVYHQFKSDDSSNALGINDLGSELGIELKAEFEHYQFIIKYADYNQDEFGIDTKRVWLSSELMF